MQLLLVISSCHLYADRREAQRTTWIKRLPPWISYFFFVGRGPALAEPDTVQLECGDGYDDLPCKSHAVFNYCLEHKEPFDWLLKVDDDTYLVPERVSQAFFDAQAEYIGSDCCYTDHYATGGAGYFLTHRLVAYLANCACPDGKDGEDGWVGARLREIGVPLYWTPLLHHSCRFLHVQRMWPGPRNNLITGHYIMPEKMRELERSFQEA